MKVWVDADSCPRVVRDIIVRAAERTGTPAVFVANRDVPGLSSDSAAFVRVAPGDDSADNHIVDRAAAGDLVVTRDIPLASKLVELGISVINDRGGVYSRENVRERLSVRDFMYSLRNNGVAPPRGKPFGMKHTTEFANSFDRELTRLRRLAGQRNR